MALLQYTTTESIKIYFDEWFDPDKLLDELKRLKNTRGGWTDIGDGQVKTLDLFSTRDGMRGDDVSSVLSNSFFWSSYATTR